MSKKINMLILAGTLAAFVTLLFLAGNSTADKSNTAFYEYWINKHIHMYLFKEHLYKSARFEHLRKSAALALKKAAFLAVNRDRLIAEMTEQRVGKKHYHIQSYLNKKFVEDQQEETRVAYRSRKSSK
jgi:hypothetical protein